VAALSVQFIALPSLGQPKQQASKLWGVRKIENLNIRPLREIPDFPGLPAYSGQTKFEKGSEQDQENGGITYQVRFLVKETPEEVRDWYANAFRMYQWKPHTNSRVCVCATYKDGNMCTVLINATKRAGFKSLINLSYNVASSSRNRRQ
jgi:hypothetical protein